MNLKNFESLILILNIFIYEVVSSKSKCKDCDNGIAQPIADVVKKLFIDTEM